MRTGTFAALVAVVLAAEGAAPPSLAAADAVGDLRAFSSALRDRDFQTASGFVADRVAGQVLPGKAGELRPAGSWGARHGWEAPPVSPLPVAKGVFMKGIRAFLEHFSEVEAFRFEAQAPAPGAGADPDGLSRLVLYVAGRDREGRREVAKGPVRVGFEKTADGAVRIDQFRVEGIESTVAARDPFSEVAGPAGVAAPVIFAAGSPGSIDADQDGLVDLLIAGTDGGVLFLNKGDGTFAKAAPGAARLAPAPAEAPAADLDNDGVDDAAEPDGLLASGVAGIDLTAASGRRVLADFDNDGDLDVFEVEGQGSPASPRLFRNNFGNDNAWIRVQLDWGAAGFAPGASVRVKGPAGTAEKSVRGSGALDGAEERLLFGLGKDAASAEVTVLWPGGETQSLGSVPARTSVRVARGKKGYSKVSEKRFKLPEPWTEDERMLASLSVKKGAKLPDLGLRALDGSAAALDDLRHSGRPAVVDLWATTCAPCGRMIKKLGDLYPQLAEAGVDVVGLSLDKDPAAVAAYLAEREITYRVRLADGPAVARLFAAGEAILPWTLFLDGEGRLVAAYSGWNPRTEKALGVLAGGAKVPAP